MKKTIQKQEITPTLADNILDSAERCFTRYGIQKTSIADICAEANISRTSVYRCFRNWDELLEGVMLRDAARLFRDMLMHIEKFETTEERVVESLMFLMNTIEKSPRLSALLTADAALLVASSNSIYQRLEVFTQPLFNTKHFRDLEKLRRDVSPDEIKEFLIQTVFGLLTLQTPASKTEKTRRKYLKNFVLPALLS